MSVDFGRKYKSAKESALGLLADLDWHSWRELESVAGQMYPRRLLDLQREGYVIERAPLPDHGKRYRLRSMAKGAPKEKTVKVYLAEADAQSIINHRPSLFAIAVVSAALGSFRRNRHKL